MLEDIKWYSTTTSVVVEYHKCGNTIPLITNKVDNFTIKW